MSRSLFRQKFSFPKDELAIVRICMKLSCCWPENDTWWKKIIRICHWPIAQMVVLPLSIWFLLTEAKNEGPFIVIQGVSDSIGVLTGIVRAGLVLRHSKDASITQIALWKVQLSPEIYRLTKILATDFKFYEEKNETVRLKRSPVVWIPSSANAIMCLFSSLMCLFALLNPGKVKTSARLPSQLEENLFLFKLVVAIFFLGHWSFTVLNVVTDGLIICSTTVIQEKAVTLKNMFESLNKINGHEEQDKKINKIVEYHALICALHQEIENMCSGPLLLQFVFLVISVGSPILRLSFSNLSTEYTATLSFLGSYIVWCTSQLAVYCLMCDNATSACLTIGKAAYGTYKSEMNPKVAKKLVVIMARAERPLHFTARKMFKINRKQLLKLIKRSYSLYSTILSRFR